MRTVHTHVHTNHADTQTYTQTYHTTPTPHTHTHHSHTHIPHRHTTPTPTHDHCSPTLPPATHSTLITSSQGSSRCLQPTTDEEPEDWARQGRLPSVIGQKARGPHLSPARAPFPQQRPVGPATSLQCTHTHTHVTRQTLLFPYPVLQSRRVGTGSKGRQGGNGEQPSWGRRRKQNGGQALPPLGQCLPPLPLVEARSLLSDWEPPSVRPVFPITARVPPGPPSPATPGFSKQAQAQLGRGTTPTTHVPPPLPTPGPGNAAERVPPGGCLRVQALLPNRRCYQPVASYSIGVGTHLPQSQSGPLPGAESPHGGTWAILPSASPGTNLAALHWDATPQHHPQFLGV